MPYLKSTFFMKNKLKKPMKKEHYDILKVACADSRLKLQDLGLLTTMLTLREGWQFSVKGLTAILPEGKSKTAATINRLIRAGYIVRKQTNNDGCYGKCIYSFTQPEIVHVTYRVRMDSERLGLLCSIVKDRNATTEERGLYAKLLTLPTRWKHTISNIAGITSDSTTKISTTIKKLIKKGLVRDAVIRDRGRFSARFYDVVQLKCSPLKKLIKQNRIREDGSSYVVVPLQDNPDTEPVSNNISKEITPVISDIITKKIIQEKINYTQLVQKNGSRIIDAIVDSLCNLMHSGTVCAVEILHVGYATVEEVCQKIRKHIKKIRNLRKYITTMLTSTLQAA